MRLYDELVEASRRRALAVMALVGVEMDEGLEDVPCRSWAPMGEHDHAQPVIRRPDAIQKLCTPANRSYSPVWKLCGSFS